MRLLPSLSARHTALAQDSNKDLLELAGQALCRQFGAPYVEALGHGSLRHLITRCAEEQPEPSRVVLPLHAFCLVQGGQGMGGWTRASRRALGWIWNGGGPDSWMGWRVSGVRELVELVELVEVG